MSWPASLQARLALSLGILLTALWIGAAGILLLGGSVVLVLTRRR